jgi:hypothetical protein
MKLAIIAFLFLSGCTPLAWTRPNTTEAEFRRDGYECERDQRAVSPSFQSQPPPYGYPNNPAGAYGAGFNDMSAGFARMAFFGRCMEAKGYTQERQ